MTGVSSSGRRGGQLPKSFDIGHVAALVALSFLPLLFGMGPVYGLFAAAGGLPFLRASWLLTRDPSHRQAMATFRSSLLQFALLALGVIMDEGLRWVL